MDRRRMAGVVPWIGCLVMVCCLGCGMRNRQAVEQEADMALVRELTAPVFFGQQQLFAALGTTAHELVVFEVTGQTVKRIPEPGTAPRLRSEARVVFFRIPDDCGEGWSLYHFDSRSFQLRALPEVKPSEAGDGSEATDSFVVFKALDRTGRWFPGEHDLSLVRLRFEVDAEGEIRFAGKKKVRDIPGEPVLPVHLRGAGRVFFLSRDNEGASTLMSVDESGEDLSTHLEEGVGTVSRIYSDDGSTLVFESDKPGYQALYRLDPATGEVADYRRLEAETGEHSRHILRSRYVDGTASPVVVRVPETLGVREVAALVTAQNPEVSLRRAELAASLVEVGIATLPNYPSFYFELGTVSQAGLFNDQTSFFSQTLIDGLLGLFQPLLDIRRNRELWRAAQLTAEAARSRLDNEVNERVAEAVKLCFEVAYLDELEAVQESLLEVYGQRQAYYETLDTVGGTLRLQHMAAEKIMVAAASEKAHTRRRREFLMNRLKQLCGLAREVQVSLAPDAFHLREAEFEEAAVLRELAVLNHPQVRGVNAELKKARFLESAGPEVRGILNVAAEYEYTGKSTSNAVTDIINLTFSGGISTAHGKAARLHTAYWRHVKDALGIELGLVAGRVRQGLDEALMDFKASQDDSRAKALDTRYALEQVRVARLYEAIDTPGDADAYDPLAVITAEQEYLSAVARKARVERDLGIRYVNVWRETGRSRLLADNLWAYSDLKVEGRTASVWLWETRAAMETKGSRDAFVTTAKEAGVNRVYAYLYSDSRLLTEMMDRERFILFLNACAQANIEVWALLGEPEWLTGPDGALALGRGVDRINRFNASRSGFEPKISGIKIDLEPHSVPGWETDPALREELNVSFLRLLKKAKSRMTGDMPLWVDGPVKWFTQEAHQPLMRQAARLTDGITVMAYFNAPETTSRVVAKVFEEAAGPLEVGLEFSGKAPPSDTLYPLDRAGWDRVEQDLSRQWMENPGYRGLSFHDYSALKQIFEGGEE